MSTTRYGQRTELHTFRAAELGRGVWPAAATGAADVTKWIYQESTGLLMQKQDAALKGATYTYDELGRYKNTSVGARNYVHLTAMTRIQAELRTITYSDSTPAVSFSYDRGGRQTMSPMQRAHARALSM